MLAPIRPAPPRAGAPAALPASSSAGATPWQRLVALRAIAVEHRVAAPRARSRARAARLYSSGTNEIRAHRITAAWEEAEVTWSSFAGSYDPAIEATLLGAPDDTGAADLTALVQAWVDGVHPNHGFLLEEDPAALTAYRSSEHANISDRPWLEVCFY
ncbi:DNRLRE domain-containing protein [Sorangium sp. So ce118]